MEVSELSKLRKELENQLSELISNELKMFTDYTNVRISNISVNPVYVGYIGSEKQDLVSVRVGVSIEV